MERIYQYLGQVRGRQDGNDLPISGSSQRPPRWKGSTNIWIKSEAAKMERIYQYMGQVRGRQDGKDLPISGSSQRPPIWKGSTNIWVKSEADKMERIYQYLGQVRGRRCVITSRRSGSKRNIGVHF